jgi:hypothetical protein
VLKDLIAQKPETMGRVAKHWLERDGSKTGEELKAAGN